jgi:hypothetical protein
VTAGLSFARCLARRAPAFTTLLLVVLIGCLLAARQAGAASPERPERRVVIVNDRGGARFLERIRAEIAALGLPVIVRDFQGPLEEAARSARAVAAIRLLPSKKGVEVWMADETSGRSLLRQVIVDEAPGGPDEGLVALQTVELLRTSLLIEDGSEPPTELKGAPAPPPPEDPPTKKDIAPSDREKAEAGLQTALGLLYSPGGANGALQLWVSLHTSLSRRIGLALDLSAPLQAATLSGPEGSADIGAYLAAVVLVGRLQPPGSRFFSNLGLGAGAARISADGTSEAPLVSNSVSQVTGVVYARADAGFEVSPWLRLGGRAVLGSVLDRVTLRFAGNEAGTWGRQLFGALALAELRWQ